MPGYSDNELINLLHNKGNKHYVYNLIVRKYQERLYWHIRKMLISHEDSDDVLQNTFIKAWKNLDGFRADSQLFTWLYRIATNEALTFLRKKRSKFFLPLVDVEKQLTDTLESDEYFNGDEIQLKLQKARIYYGNESRNWFIGDEAIV